MFIIKIADYEFSFEMNLRKVAQDLPKMSCFAMLKMEIKKFELQYVKMKFEVLWPTNTRSVAYAEIKKGIIF